jgi:hypothetical protein
MQELLIDRDTFRHLLAILMVTLDRNPSLFTKEDEAAYNQLEAAYLTRQPIRITVGGHEPRFST